MPSRTSSEATRRHQKRRDQQDAIQALVRYAHVVLNEARLDRSPSWVSRTVREYARRGVGRCTFGTWLTDKLGLTEIQRSRAEAAYVLAYSDPTGETAVRNLTGRGA